MIKLYLSMVTYFVLDGIPPYKTLATPLINIHIQYSEIIILLIIVLNENLATDDTFDTSEADYCSWFY